MDSGVTILIADDDRELGELLSEYLQSEGFTVLLAHDGEAALGRALNEPCELMVLDIMMPKMNGMEVLKALRMHSALPVIMLTARGEPVDRIVGLEIGADDYLAKPCNPSELIARIRAVLRRAGSTPKPVNEGLVVDDVELMPQSRTVLLNGKEVELTSTEFELLALLLAHAGEVVGKEHISSRVLGRRLAAYDRSIDMHVSKLRKKLGLRPDGSERIKTVRGAGYLYVR